MRRFASIVAMGPLALGLAGCPIYGSDGGFCDPAFEDCGQGGSAPNSCTQPSQCEPGQVCGQDNVCHLGSCLDWGCLEGYLCAVTADGDATCVPDDGSGGAGGGAGGAGGGGGAPPVYCGNPDDCAETETCAPDGTCQAALCDAVGCIFGYVCDTTAEVPGCIPVDDAACGADADCAAVPGAKCVSGLCTPAEDQCFDQTQCPAGDVCAEGKCVPSCAGGAACPDAYTCTSGVELCTTPVLGCTITNDCASAELVCVDGACVPRADGGLCGVGEVWVENGCIPDQSAIFTCQVEGEQDACAAGSICVHHSCYISCAPPNDAACASTPPFDQCKPVTTTSGTYPVCGSDQNLGGECDPTQGLGCAMGLVCIDGFCK